MKKWFKKDDDSQGKIDHKSNEPELVLLISAPSIWSAHVDSWLQERDIPYLKRGQMGAGLAIKLGHIHEVIDFYVPYERLEEAQEGLDELKEIIGY